MLDIQQVIEKLQGMNYAQVAKDVGVTRSYICAIANKKRVNPSYEMIKRLSDYLEAK